MGIDYNTPPDISKLPDDKLIVVTDTQISRLSATPVGSISYFRANDILKPAVPGSNVYRAADLRAFCNKRIQEASLRVASALKSANPSISENELVAQALKQLHAETK